MRTDGVSPKSTVLVASENFVTRNELISRVRTLINDPQGRGFRDEKILEFLAIAEEKLPFIAAALIAASVGSNETSRLMMAMAGMFSNEEQPPVLMSSTKGPE